MPRGMSGVHSAGRPRAWSCRFRKSADRRARIHALSRACRVRVIRVNDALFPSAHPIIPYGRCRHRQPERCNAIRAYRRAADQRPRSSRGAHSHTRPWTDQGPTASHQCLNRLMRGASNPRSRRGTRIESCYAPPAPCGKGMAAVGDGEGRPGISVPRTPVTLPAAVVPTHLACASLSPARRARRAGGVHRIRITGRPLGTGVRHRPDRAPAPPVTGAGCAARVHSRSGPSVRGGWEVAISHLDTPAVLADALKRLSTLQRNAAEAVANGTRAPRGRPRRLTDQIGGIP